MYVCVAENADLLVFFTFFCTFPIGNFLSEGRFWTTTLPHHTPPPIPKLSSITKTRILFVFVPKKVPVTFTKISLSEGLGYLKLHKGKVQKKRGNYHRKHGTMKCFFLLRFAHFSKFSIYVWGKKVKVLVFQECMYV